ncbi:Rap1a/Tai family immunity protein [Ferrovibrio xuzhouensis]|uniref:Rap1a/Tai family immunity protein n=1 Tax=Ferrovibrio xuzhouensis TaxID=1576914 RepID=A0ABV7VB92_9PROT
MRASLSAFLPALLTVLLFLATSAVAPAQTAPATPSADSSMPAGLAPPPKFLAKDLLTGCQAADGSVQQRGCLRYLQGAAAMYNLIAADGKDPGWFCTPRDAPAEMLRQQFVSWAQDNADQMGLEAIQALRLALADAFPCQE